MENRKISPKSTISVLLLIIALLLPQVGWAQTASQPQKGDGSKDNPYEISTAAELAWFREYVNAGNASVYAKLINDIDLKDFCHAADESNNVAELSWEPIGSSSKEYKGSFDGNGKTISNLYINRETSYTGLFGYLSYATIKDIIFDKAQVECNKSYTAIAVGNGSYSTLQNIKTSSECSVTGGSRVGGIIGNVEHSSISYCENRAPVNGTKYTGGIVGALSDQSNINACTNYGAVTSTSVAGGIVGNCAYSNMQNISNYGTIGGTDFSGGFIGTTTASDIEIKNGISYGTISESEYRGLIIGEVPNGGYVVIDGIIAYNSNIKLAYVGRGKTIIPGGKSYYDIVKGVTSEQIKSGEATYLLNGSTSTPAEGESLTWYQKIGTDDIPMPTSKGDDIVYHGKDCDKTTDVYTNDKSIFGEDGAIPHNMIEIAETNGLYHVACTRCHAENEEGIHYIKDFCGISGNNFKLSLETDGSYKAVEQTVTITDKETYDSPVDFVAEKLEYTREYLGNNMWQAVYVPFDVEATDWNGNEITAACINNFHEYELEDGNYETVLEVKKATSGSLSANTPYVIRSTDGGSKTITLQNALLHKAASQTIDCQSVTRKYEFTGIYTPQSGFNQEGSTSLIYALNKQGSMAPLSKTATLGAQRWYLAITDRNAASTPQAAMARDIRIRMIGEDTATGIGEVKVLTSEGNATQSGTYDLQGRKLNDIPSNGIYIQNGKKYVK